MNRLAKITYLTGDSSNFAYDGASRRIAIVEKSGSGTVTSTKLYLWLGNSIVDERNSTNIVQKRFYPQGEQQSGTEYFYTRDHLGSIRELISSTGTILSRLSYDIYGRMTIVSGTVLPTFRYAGYYDHTISGLYLTVFRAFDPNIGRWISRDPISESGGIDLYAYCGNNPINATDPSGLFSPGPLRAPPVPIPTPWVAGGLIAANVAIWGYDIYEYTGLLRQEYLELRDEAATQAEADYLEKRLKLKTQTQMPPPEEPPCNNLSTIFPDEPWGSNNANRMGQGKHDLWQPPDGFDKNFTFKNGLRPDAINIAARQIIEYKPNTPTGLAKGAVQLAGYIKSAQAEFGGNWTGWIETYEPNY